MNSKPGTHSQEHLDLVFLFALQALSPREMASVEAQISSCEDCRQELETLRPIVSSFVGWPTDVLRPAESLWGRLAKRIASQAGTPPFVPSSEATGETRVGGSGARYPRQNTREERGNRQRKHVGPP